MSDTNRNRFLYEHSGMLQSDRLALSPSPDAMKVSGRPFEDLVKRSAEFAKSVIYYGDDNKADGDWKAFFNSIYDYEEHKVLTDVIDDMTASSSVPPHLALMFAFFKMLLIEQDNFNNLTDRQMDYYFKTVLGFQRKKHTEGIVTVIAELNKNASEASISKGAQFEAGKDSNGKKILYQAVDELRLGTDKVDSIMLYSDDDGFKVLGEDGSSRHGFCLACPILDIPKAKMSIKLTTDTDTLNALSSLNVEYSSEEGWTSAGRLDLSNGVVIEKDQPSPTSCDPLIHGEGFDIPYPVLRFVSRKGYQPLKNIHPSRITKVTVTAEDGEPLGLENKFGGVENKEGINPFGPEGKKGDYFRVILPFESDDAATDIEVKLNDSSVFETPSIDSRINSRALRTLRQTKVKVSVPIGRRKASAARFRRNLSVSYKEYEIANDKCDQQVLSREYAKSVIKLMKNQSSTNTDVDNALNKSLIAVVPKLLSPVVVKKAIYKSSDIRMFFMHPKGVMNVDGTIYVNNKVYLGSKKSAIYLGLSDQNQSKGQISLYFENSGLSSEPGQVSWSCLRNGQWENFGSSQIIKDTTCGLSQNGTVVLDVTSLIGRGDGTFRSDNTWLRVICSNSNCTDVTGVVSRAIELEYCPDSEGIGPQGEPLPMCSVSKPVLSIAGLKSISQQFDGSAGTKAETDAMYRRRVAETLRHKGKAWSVWDYESIVLEKFSDIAYVKCLPCVDLKGNNKPGEVTVCIIPAGQNSSLTPSAGNVMINAVRKAVKEVCSPFVDVNITNPTYVSVKVVADITLRKGFNDAVKYQAYISDSLKDYLRPWIGAKDNGQHISDGCGVSDIIAYLETIPYVDVINSIKVFADGKLLSLDGRISLSSPIEILTSAKEHSITCQTSQR